MKVSLVVRSLDENPIVRAFPFHAALTEMGYEVEVVGFIKKGEEVYFPYRELASYNVVEREPGLGFLTKSLPQLVRKIDGDIVYCFKPVLTTLLPSLLAHFLRSKPLYFDAEDNDVEAHRPRKLQDLSPSNLKKNFTYFLATPLRLFLGNCEKRTVSSRALETLYKGDMRVLHGPPHVNNYCEVGSERQSELRDKFGLPHERTLLGFAGKPRGHKGFNAVFQAFEEATVREHFHLVLVGDPEDETFLELKERFPERVSLVGFLSHEEVGDAVQAFDIVLAIQEKSTFSEAQIPAKILESFAYARPILTTRVGDLPLLAGEEDDSQRGFVIESSTSDELRLILGELALREDIRKELVVLGSRARQYYEEELSTPAMIRKLKKLGWKIVT